MSGVLARCRDAIVAGAAGADDLRVINGEYRHENVRVVAIFAHIARLDMRQAFADCFCAVVTAYAVARDVDVIKVRR